MTTGDLPEIILALTAFQAAEVAAGLDIDAADHHDEPLWGQLVPVGRTGRACLVIAGTQLARDRALYRITSGRDIWKDNAGGAWSNRERLTYASGARSLSGLTAKLIEAAGGPEGFSTDVRRWIAY